MDILRQLRLKYSRRSYQQLPTSITDSFSPSSPSSQFEISQSAKSPLNRRTRRHAGLAVLATIALLVIARSTVYHWTALPDYADIKNYESHLPQHNLDLPFPEGRNGRYVKFSVPITHKGWNNVLEDIIMLSQTALMANRGYVFPSYTWSDNRLSPVVPDSHWRARSSVIPLNAFVSGPLAGGPIQNATDTAPRAISDAWWDVVCPNTKRVYVGVKTTRQELGLDVKYPEGKEVFEKWAAKLSAIQDSCVEVWGDHIWSFGDGGSMHTISAWDVLKTSPILSQFAWSPLVDSIIRANLPLLLDSNRLEDRESSPLPRTMEGLLAVHLRRGDFVEHCEYLRKRGLDYAVWNAFPDYPDKMSTRSPSDLYTKHCIPTVEAAVQRIREVKRDWESSSPDASEGDRRLRRMYIMTNAEPTFISALRIELSEDGWDSISTSYDIAIPRAAVEVDMAADMLIGERAEVFLGNAYSTLTSNVNIIRRSRQAAAESARFW